MSSPNLDRTYTIDDLAALANLPPRTIRYYIQLGLVDRPVGETRAAYYTWQHLGRLLEIRKLTAQGFSLERASELIRQAQEPPAPGRTAPRAGSVSVQSHLHVADGVELIIDPARANHSPEKLRRLSREILAACGRVLKEPEQ